MKISTALLTAILIAWPFRASAQEASEAPTPDPTPSPTPTDVLDTRLLFSPTGRPLAKGAGYFSDHYVLFPGIAYGLTDNFSIAAGMSVLPGYGLGEQLFYISPRLGKQFSENLAVSGGAVYASGGEGLNNDDVSAGFAMATFGRPDRSVTVGGGVLRTVETRTEARFVNGRVIYDTREAASHTPALLVGGVSRLSRRIALVSENWLILHDDFNIKEQPFALGVRFLGDRLSADVGVILIGEALDDGFPIPWLSVSYHFGRKR
jgi:hypothetical protein